MHVLIYGLCILKIYIPNFHILNYHNFSDIFMAKMISNAQFRENVSFTSRLRFPAFRDIPRINQFQENIILSLYMRLLELEDLKNNVEGI